MILLIMAKVKLDLSLPQGERKCSVEIILQGDEKASRNCE